MVWVDFETQQRIPKSAHWYSGVIEKNAVEV